MNALIMIFGIVLNELPYIILGLLLVWNNLRYGRKLPIVLTAVVVSLRVAYIMTAVSFLPEETISTIKPFGEMAYLALQAAFFILVAKTKPSRLLFLAFFVKHFADIIIYTSAYIQMNFLPDTHGGTHANSFNLHFNLIHLALLCVFYPLMILFIRRVIQKLYLVESRVWKYLWLVPLVFFVLGFVITNYNINNVVITANIGAGLFLISLFVYALIFYALRTEKDKALAEYRTETAKQKIEFYRKMSHSLRTPLTIVSTNIQTAKRRPQEADELLTKSQDEIMKMAALISDALKDGEKGAGE